MAFRFHTLKSGNTISMEPEASTRQVAFYLTPALQQNRFARNLA
jgi:hypothetical protein